MKIAVQKLKLTILISLQSVFTFSFHTFSEFSMEIYFLLQLPSRTDGRNSADSRRQFNEPAVNERFPFPRSLHEHRAKMGKVSDARLGNYRGVVSNTKKVALS